MKNLVQNKNRRKVIRSIIQAIVLIGVSVLIINATFNLKKYADASQNSINGDHGFIAISYFGVDQTGDDTLISTKLLSQHLESLHKTGYVTISQQDVLDYYKNGKELPEKALFLIFEDGRRDTAIFAQEIMEKYNFKATMLTYADKFEKRDPKFLSPDDLIQMEKSTFWELGTNGYRLEYINVFDRYYNYLGQLDSLEFANVSYYLGRDYNHYLMDYLRDEYDIPTETYEEMSERVSNDYEKMANIYTKETGELPKLYILMHSNTGQFASNDKVSIINEKKIKELFDMNYNREGNACNSLDSSIYDLTRLQPQSYWSTNHLLMKIQNDTQQDIDYVSGNADKKSKWEIICGASEFLDEKIILTSLPERTGLMRLNNSENFRNIDVSMSLLGNVFGVQKVYLRADDDLASALSVEITNDQLILKEKSNDAETILADIKLKGIDGTEIQSIEEDKKNAEIEALKTKIQYASSVNEATAVTELLNRKLQEEARTVEDGSMAYEPMIDIRENGKRQLDISIYEDTLSVKVDNKLVVDKIKIDNSANGAFYLESAWGGYGYSQRNLTDDVYDGIFDKIMITENGSVFGAENGTIIFETNMHGAELWLSEIKKAWSSIINWFIKTL